MPPYIPFHIEMVYISGFFEVLFGFFLLFKKLRKISALGIIILLIAVFPANIYIYQNPEILCASKSQAFIRLCFSSSFNFNSLLAFNRKKLIQIFISMFFNICPYSHLFLNTEDRLLNEKSRL